MTAGTPAAAAAIRPITEGEFRRIAELVYREAGIRLSPGKEALVMGRLAKRMRELGIATYGAYHRLCADDAGERVRMLDALCTHETHFFREPRHFQFLQETVFPRWRAEAEAGRRPRQVRVWSAGCSSGEEPFSLAMLLLEHFPAGEGWDASVLATDLSTRVLERAREATWPIARAAEVPSRLLKKYLLRGTRSQEGRMAAGPELRSVVRFARVNLNDESYSVGAPFDLVFCRNVLIYFDAVSRRAVVERLLHHLRPDGYFFVGHAETLHNVTPRARAVIPTVYAAA